MAAWHALADLLETALQRRAPTMVMMVYQDRIQYANINGLSNPLWAMTLLEIASDLLDSVTWDDSAPGTEYTCIQARTRVQTALRLLKPHFPSPDTVKEEDGKPQ